MSTPEPPAEAPAPRALLPAYRALPSVQRDALQLLAALLAGVLLMPLLIWGVGSRVLGPYTHGQNQHAGPLALLGDFLVALAHGAPVHWAVALGPALIWLLLRLGGRVWRALP